MAAEFVEADRATRLKVLAVAAVLVLLPVLERLTAPDPAARVTDPVLAFKQMTDRLLLVTCVAAIVTVVWGPKTLAHSSGMVGNQRARSIP